MDKELVKVSIPASVRQQLKIEAARRSVTMAELLTDLVAAVNGEPAPERQEGSSAALLPPEAGR